jgi:hypothetical protein
MLNEAMKDDITVDCGLSSSLFIYNVHFSTNDQQTKSLMLEKRFAG